MSAIIACLPSVSNLPLMHWVDEEHRPAVQEIAQRALKELAMAIVFSGVCCFFVATPLGMAALVGGNIGLVALTAAWRVYLVYISTNDAMPEEGRTNQLPCAAHTCDSRAGLPMR